MRKVLALILLLPFLGSVVTQQPAHAWPKTPKVIRDLDVTDKNSGIRTTAEDAKRLTYKTHVNYIQLVAALKVAKKNNLVRNRNECYQLAEHGSTAAAAASTAMKVVVKVVGRDAGRTACQEVF